MLRHTYYDKNEMRMPDRTSIDLTEYYDVEYWSKRFGVSPELLANAVKASGTTVADEVELYIRNKYPF
ncbi:DUF3606 domain-containing protein [Pedobacter sp. L105]|uniref:DUF3606 domain-containing protein n=1 Tax=Pedobacter sp. L105 TaxID=1641871 RepID=UPI001C20730D|nr:DUF3606 domain-containing protein [Pedobacter sp. L105]